MMRHDPGDASARRGAVAGTVGIVAKSDRRGEGAARPLVRALVLAAALVGASCTSEGRGDGPDPSNPPAAPTSSAEPAATVAPDGSTTTIAPDGSTTIAPDGPTSSPALDDQIDWVLEILNGRTPTEEELIDRFTADFLRQVPPNTLLTVFRQLRARSAQWTVTGIETDGVGAEVRLTGEDEWLMQIGVAPTGEVEFLLFQPDTVRDADEPTTFDELVTVLDEAGDLALLAADVSGGTCEEIHAVDATTPRPIGSDFKLYVLGALADAVRAGDIGWNDTLAIRDDLKSLPSGTYQVLTAGTRRTVREFALAMISTSDNTATDHLIHLLGRERVEAAQAAYGHADPALNDPLLTTREFFVLKLALSDDDRAAYIAAGPDERRRILDTVVAETDVTLDDAVDWLAPRAIEEIEYFASPHDLCRAMVALNADRLSRPTIREVLGANPGVPIDDRAWSYVGFKGGSEPGVLSLAWYLEGASGTFVYVVNVTNGDSLLNEAQLAVVAAVGIDLLAAG